MEIISKGAKYNIDECINCGCRFKFYDNELTPVKYKNVYGVTNYTMQYYIHCPQCNEKLIYDSYALNTLKVDFKTNKTEVEEDEAT